MTNANELIHSFNSTPDSEGNFYGLTKREYFAAMALQGLLANTDLTKTDDVTIAMTCIDAADALINALNEIK